MNVDKLRDAIESGQFEWRKHIIERLAERKIKQEEVLQTILTGEKIEGHPQAYPFPSALFFRKIAGSPLHVVVAFDEENDWAYIVTAYIADLEHFENDFKTRRKQ